VIGDETTLVLVELGCDGTTGLGYTYADVATGKLITGLLAEQLAGKDPFDHGTIRSAMIERIRNLGRSGVTTMAIAAVDNDFRSLVGVIDVMQADATRCEGISGLLNVGALCEAYDAPLSTHCAPALHAHAAAALKRLRHIEWFHDHARLERTFFDGVTEPCDGTLSMDARCPGNGLTVKRAAIERYGV